MEQWEHMIVQLEVTTEAQQLFAYTADDDKVLVDDTDVSNARVLQALNEFGREGWQLVSVDHSIAKAGALSSYYLKRRLEEAATVGGRGVAGA